MNASELESLLQEEISNMRFAIDTVWCVMTGVGILLMQIGFALLETGAISTKNTKGTLLKNISDASIGAVVWVMFGWGLYSGDHPFASGNGATFVGTHTPNVMAKIFLTFGFATTANTLVSGAIIGRCRFTVYLMFSIWITGICFPTVAHWAWAENGWLQEMGFLDYAGGAVVHLFGACAAQAAAVIVGPRVGRFIDEDEMTAGGSVVGGGSQGKGSGPGTRSISSSTILFVNMLRTCCHRRCHPRLAHCVDVSTGDGDSLRRVREMPPHSPVLFALGGLLIWVGWFSFNGGSVPSMTTDGGANTASLAVLNTLLGAGSGTCFGLIWCFLLRGRFDLMIVINSMLTSLVVITPMAGNVENWVSVFSGAVGILTYTFFRYLNLYGFAVDDPLDIFAVHGAGGLVGTVLLGFFDNQFGFVYTGDARFLGVQLLGSLVISLAGFATAILYFLPCKYTIGLVYSKDDQLAGLDFLHFELESKADFDCMAVREHNVRERMKRQKAAARASKEKSRKQQVSDAGRSPGSPRTPSRGYDASSGIMVYSEEEEEQQDIEKGKFEYSNPDVAGT